MYRKHKILYGAEITQNNEAYKIPKKKRVKTANEHDILQSKHESNSNQVTSKK